MAGSKMRVEMNGCSKGSTYLFYFFSSFSLHPRNDLSLPFFGISAILPSARLSKLLLLLWPKSLISNKNWHNLFLFCHLNSRLCLSMEEVPENHRESQGNKMVEKK